MADVTRTTVVIYGEEYPLKSDLPEEAVQALGRLVDNRMRLLAVRHPRVPAGRLAVLAAMTLAEELMTLKAEHEEALRALQAQWRRTDKSALRGKAGTPG
jgi:cell division protein ZapA